MYILNDNKVLPEIFSETKDFFALTAEKINNFKAKLLAQEQPLNSVCSFFEKYNNYQMNGFNIFKTAMGDLGVGVRALGNKFGVLGGESFVALKEGAENLISKIGEFFNFMTSFIVSSDEVLNPSEKNMSSFNVLIDTVNDFLNSLISGMQILSDSLKYLYGDTKERLADKFDLVKDSMVNFIHMAKIKIVSAIANSFVGVKVAFDNFDGLVESTEELPFNNHNLLNMEGYINKVEARVLLQEIIKDFPEALAQANIPFAE